MLLARKVVRQLPHRSFKHILNEDKIAVEAGAKLAGNLLGILRKSGSTFRLAKLLISEWFSSAPNIRHLHHELRTYHENGWACGR